MAEPELIFDPFSPDNASPGDLEHLALTLDAVCCRATFGLEPTDGVSTRLVRGGTDNDVPHLVTPQPEVVQLDIHTSGDFWRGVLRRQAESPDPLYADALVGVADFLGSALTALDIVWRPGRVEQVSFSTFRDGEKPSGIVAVDPGRTEVTVAQGDLSKRLPLFLPMPVPAIEVPEGAILLRRALPPRWIYEGTGAEVMSAVAQAPTTTDVRALHAVFGTLRKQLVRGAVASGQ